MSNSKTKEELMAMDDEQAKELTEGQKKARLRFLAEKDQPQDEPETKDTEPKQEPETKTEPEAEQPAPPQIETPVEDMKYTIAIASKHVGAISEKDESGRTRRHIFVTVNGQKTKVYCDEPQTVSREVYIALQGVLDIQSRS